MKNLLFLLFILPFALRAQPSHTPTILGLMAYRHQLITDNPAGFEKIYTLDELWAAENREKAGQFMLNIVYFHEIYGMSAKKIMGKYEKRDSSSWIPALLTEEAIEAIIQNKDLIDLVNGGFLLSDTPFQIDPTTSLFEELDFYGIKNRMTIAEIGAGNGTFSLLLGLGHDSLHIYVNDTDLSALHYAQAKIIRCASRKASNEYDLVKGKKKSTELPSASMDKIIIRNSFHHFSHKKEMLESIRATLKPNAELYIFDPIIYPDKKLDCQAIMHLEDIQQVLKENGFEIVAEKIKEDWGCVLLHCRPEP